MGLLMKVKLWQQLSIGSKVKEYSEERQKIRQYIRKDDLSTKKKGGVIDWGYLLNAADGF